MFIAVYYLTMNCAPICEYFKGVQGSMKLNIKALLLHRLLKQLVDVWHSCALSNQFYLVNPWILFILFSKPIHKRCYSIIDEELNFSRDSIFMHELFKFL